MRHTIDITALPNASGVTRVYAIGDIHGRLDLLLKIEIAIHDDLASHPTAGPLICYLGDYVDRGPASAGVLADLAGRGADGVRRAFLKGNHEDRMLDFLREPAANGPSWMKFGGREALESYGITKAKLDGEDWAALRDGLAAALPATHLAFLQGLELALRWNGYLFVHAGLDPGRDLQAQNPHDLMWIREPFLSSDRDWGLRVVHGHVIAPEPVIRANRIGLDTGAYKSGILTCAAIETELLRIIQVT
jgi:serine/threonine protein phosphatase 1